MLAEYGELKNDTSLAMARELHEALGRAVSIPDLGALRELLDAAQADGSIRADLTAEDVFLLVGFLWRIERTPDRVERAERMLDVIINGLRAAPTAPHHPLT
jgi:hypothetical protein